MLIKEKKHIVQGEYKGCLTREHGKAFMDHLL